LDCGRLCLGLFHCWYFITTSTNLPEKAACNLFLSARPLIPK
jgi:hypothetical protein